jgi:hypothetical protein
LGDAIIAHKKFVVQIFFSCIIRVMNTQHTPGPWTFYRRSSCDRGDSYGVRAPAPHHWVIPTLNINPADARLIAAAPDLLEALKLAVRQNSHDMLMTGEELRKCEAAIARATNA